MNTPVPPTQVVYPGKTVIRTVIQLAVGLAAVAPFLAADLGIGTTSGLFAGALGIAAALTRVMAIPAVDRLLSGLGLGAEPNEKP